MSILELKNICYTYGVGTPFEKKAVNDVSFSVNKGELIGIIGHTGSGKSTLVQMLNGLMKPTSGQVLLDGVDIWDKPKEIRKIRFKVGMVFQYPEYQLFEETVYKDISFGPFNKGLSQEEIDKEVRRAAKFTGIKDELLYKSPFDLSGGEKRRAAIAGVIAMDPDVLVLDEPTAGLDPMGRDVLLSQIVRYHKDRQNTVLLVSHSMEDIARVADRIVVMNKSQLVMFDETQKVFARGDELEKIGLRIPQITKIMSQLRKRGVDVPEGILTVDSAVDYLLPLIKKEAKERNFVQSQDIGKVNKAEIKEAMDGVLKKMQGFDFTKFKEELGKRGFKVREARASTGKLNGYYVTARSGTEYKASEIGKGYTLAHIERTQSKLKCNSMNISHGNKLTPGSGSFQR